MYIVLFQKIKMTKSSEVEELPLSVINVPKCFGAEELIDHTSRMTRARTLRDSTFVFISKRNFEKVIRVDPEILKNEEMIASRRQLIADVVKSLPFFSSLKLKEVGPLITYNDEKLFKLGELLELREFNPGEAIYSTGDLSQGVFYIISGSVNVYAQGVATGDKSTINQLMQDTWFGDLNRERSTTVKANGPTPVKLLYLPRKNYISFQNTAPTLARLLDGRLRIRSVEWLEKLAIFADIKENKPWSKFGLLGSLLNFKECNTGEVICREGETDRSFYIVDHGRFKVTVNDNGRELPMETLKEESMFGELALLQGLPCISTVTCVSPGLLCVLSHEAYQRFIRVAPELEDTFSSLILNRTATTLKKFRIFDHVRENKPWSKIELLASLLSYQRFDQGQIVLKEGDETNSLYLLLHGKVITTVRDSSGRIIDIEELASGDFVGEESLMTPAPTRRTTVRTTVPTLFLVLSREAFHKFLAVTPEIVPPLTEMITNRKLAAEEHMSSSHPELVDLIKYDNDDVKIGPEETEKAPVAETPQPMKAPAREHVSLHQRVGSIGPVRSLPKVPAFRQAMGLSVEDDEEFIRQAKKQQQETAQSVVAPISPGVLQRVRAGAEVGPSGPLPKTPAWVQSNEEQNEDNETAETDAVPTEEEAFEDATETQKEVHEPLVSTEHVANKDPASPEQVVDASAADPVSEEPAASGVAENESKDSPQSGVESVRQGEEGLQAALTKDEREATRSSPKAKIKRTSSNQAIQVDIIADESIVVSSSSAASQAAEALSRETGSVQDRKKLFLQASKSSPVSPKNRADNQPKSVIDHRPKVRELAALFEHVTKVRDKLTKRTKPKPSKYQSDETHNASANDTSGSLTSPKFTQSMTAKDVAASPKPTTPAPEESEVEAPPSTENEDYQKDGNTNDVDAIAVEAAPEPEVADSGDVETATKDEDANEPDKANLEDSEVQPAIGADKAESQEGDEDSIEQQESQTEETGDVQAPDAHTGGKKKRKRKKKGKNTSLIS